MQNVLHSVSTSRIILHLRLTACQPGVVDGSALLSAEYMKKRMAFQNQQNSGDTDSEYDFMPVELEARGSSMDIAGEEKKQYVVVNPCMI
ncbi:hypothetical protein SCHPADRAFT_579316 [Schizopora paradoxa]|uniref:Uncharacterized protein n=1 Tax=Schizopora paradoxa TaxID=27342 RepID=A0A0H2RB71_9AGAM|nr:hypothetical protein SCHPADRAFT_579316 [Schizopora paradoxa]